MGRQQLAPLDLRAALRLTGSAGAIGEVLTSQGPGAAPIWLVPGGISDGDKGDITVAGGGTTWTIDNGAVTLAKQADLSTQRVIGRNTAGSGVPEEVSLSQLLDWASSTRGAILYRGASGWQALAPPTGNSLLFHDGGTSDPTWVDEGDYAFVTSGIGQFPSGSSDEIYSLVTNPTGTGSLVFAEGPQIIFGHTTISYAATVDLDMAALAGLYRTISLTGNLELTTSNRASGRTLVLRLISDASTRTLTFPAGWVFVGAKPADIAASKTGVLSLSFFGTADTDCVAAWSVQA